MSLTTYNACDMTNYISQLHALLMNFYPSSYSALRLFLVLYFAHVMHLVLKEIMKIIHSDMDAFRSMINAVLASNKLRDEFEVVACELVASYAIPQAVHLINYATEMRWSLAFRICNQPYKARKGFQMTRYLMTLRRIT